MEEEVQQDLMLQPATGGNGGAGSANSISGSSVTYAGGGGGGLIIRVGCAGPLQDLEDLVEEEQELVGGT
jgi:hypothetical protein